MLQWALAIALMGGAVFHIAHLISGGLRGRRNHTVDGVHAAMAGAMALALVTDLGLVSLVFAAGFGATALWLAVRALAQELPSRADVARLSVCSAVMVGMFSVPMHVSAPTSSAMAGMSGMGSMPGMVMPGATGDRAWLILLVAMITAQIGLAIWTASPLLDRRRAELQPSDRWHVGGQVATTLGGAAMVALMM